jgi:hypothetical protein
MVFASVLVIYNFHPACCLLPVRIFAKAVFGPFFSHGKQIIEINPIHAFFCPLLPGFPDVLPGEKYLAACSNAVFFFKINL